MKPFTTSRATIIPGVTMEHVCAAVRADEDWQKIATEILRPLIPEVDDDLSEVNEVLSEAEQRNEEGASLT